MIEYCELCNAELHSITMRRVNEHKICRECGNKVTPLIEQVIEQEFKRIQQLYAPTP